MLKDDIKKVEYSKAIINNGITTATGISWLILKYEFKLIFNTGECTLFSVTTSVYDCFRPNRKLMWWKKDSLKKIRSILEFFEKDDKFIYCRRIEKFSRDEILIREEKSGKLLQKITLSPSVLLYFPKDFIGKLWK